VRAQETLGDNGDSLPTHLSKHKAQEGEQLKYVKSNRRSIERSITAYEHVES